jgi:hypothetical protein
MEPWKMLRDIIAMRRILELFMSAWVILRQILMKEETDKSL